MLVSSLFISKTSMHQGFAYRVNTVEKYLPKDLHNDFSQVGGPVGLVGGTGRRKVNVRDGGT